MSVMDSIEEKYQEEIAALKEENTALKVAFTEQRRWMGAGYDYLVERLKNVQSIAAGEIQDYAKTVERLNKLTATLKAELDTEKAIYKSLCEHHEAQTKHYEEQIAALNRIIDTQVSAQTACPVCSGDGRTISGMLCVCNGSGKITDAYDYLRKYNLELEKQIAGLEKTASEQDNCILHFQTRVAALKAEIERLREVKG